MSFKSAREKAGMTLTKAAQMIGVSKAAVSLWETGKMAPRADKLPRIAEIYGCRVDDLLRKEDE